MASSDFFDRRRNISLSNGHYSLWQGGRGQLLVLLHGWPVTSRHWEKVIPPLINSGYEVCSIDLKGLGESRSSAGSFAKGEIAQEILDVIACCYPGIASFSVMGHDWGGSIALAMTLFTKKIRRLIIEEEITPGVSVPLSEKGTSTYPTWHGAFHRAKPLAEQLIRNSQREYFNFFLNLRADHKSLSPELRNHYLDAYDTEDRLSLFLEYYRTIESDKAFFQALAQRKIGVPILGLGGQHAMGSGVLECLRYFHSRPEFYLCENSGHYPAEEEPERVSDLVIKFLAND